jgi:diacylglycerol O-acyltransferase / wax synthase
VQQLSGMDASFVYFETQRTPTHVAGLYLYDPSTAPGGQVGFDQVRRHLQRRLHLARAFRQKMVRVPFDLDHPYWIEDPDFDLDYHLRRVALPRPGDWRQLCDLAARFHAQPMDLSRPLWELYVIEGADAVEGLPPGGFALLQKTHHAAIDGVSGMELSSAIHTLTPDDDDVGDDDRWQPEQPPPAWQLLGRAAVANTVRPMHFARVVGRHTPGYGRVLDTLRRRQLPAPPLGAPRTRFNGRVSPHRVVDARRFDLAEVRRIKSAVAGATVNDVVLAVIGGALRHHLAAVGELPAEPMLAMAPISVRTDDERGTAGNQVSAMVVSLATDVADPLARLEVVRASTARSKELTSAIGARALTEYSQFIPGGLAGLGFRAASRFEMANRVDPIVNAIVTNVPGPQVPLYFAGAQLLGLVGMGPIADGVGLMHPVTSYCGELVIAVTADRAMLPDPERYARCLQDSFDELARAVA